MSGNGIDYSCEGCVWFHFGLMYSPSSCDKRHQIEATRCYEYQSVKDVLAENKRLRDGLVDVTNSDHPYDMAYKVLGKDCE